MTNHTAPIGYVQQLLFCVRKPSNIDIYIAYLGSRRAGYLLLRHERGTTLVTEAVDEPFRGMGVATRMVQYAKHLCPDLTAEIRADNTASIRLHRSAGFTLETAQSDVQTFRFVRQDANPRP